MDKWQGKVAVVTGASSGIGAAIVKDLAEYGLIVIGLARQDEKIEEISKELQNSSGKIYAKKCDIGDLESIKETFKWIEDKFQKIHVLINNAAVSHYSDILNPSDEKTERLNEVINTNFTGLLHCTRFAYKLMNDSKDYGIIINIGSVLGVVIQFPNPSSVYPATKFAVRALTESIRQELIVLENDKIRIATVNPGIVKTNLAKSAGCKDPESFYKNNPCLAAEDVSQSVIYLLSTPHNVNVTEITIRPVGQKS